MTTTETNYEVSPLLVLDLQKHVQRWAKSYLPACRDLRLSEDPYEYVGHGFHFGGPYAFVWLPCSVVDENDDIRTLYMFVGCSYREYNSEVEDFEYGFVGCSNVELFGKVFESAMSPLNTGVMRWPLNAGNVVAVAEQVLEDSELAELILKHSNS